MIFKLMSLKLKCFVKSRKYTYTYISGMKAWNNKLLKFF